MKSEAKMRLEAANQAVAMAAMVLRGELETMSAFLKECEDMDNFGYIATPTLANNSEHHAVSALIEPLYKASIDFVRLYDVHTTKAKDALAKVA